MDSAPHEIVVGPLEVWIALVGSVFPRIDRTPGGVWVRLGVSGTRSYGEDGVNISHPQSVEMLRTAGSTGPVKAVRTEEELHLALSLLDLTLEAYQAALNFNVITTVAAATSVPGTKEIGLYRGATVAQRALLARGLGMSSYGNFNLQYEWPVVVEIGEPEPVFTKGEGAALALDFAVLEDPNAVSADRRFGRLLVQNAAPIGSPSVSPSASVSPSSSASPSASTSRSPSPSM